MKKAALLARVSTENQKEEATIDSQVAEIQERIKSDGNVLLDQCIYKDEGYSGELLARPALDKMRDDAKKGMFEILYVYDRGRLSRKFSFQELIIDELNDLGILFVTLHDAKAETPEEKVLQAMQGVFHEYERIKITERFRRGKLYKVKNGHLLGYCPPYGYNYIHKTKDTEAKFEINEAEATVVKQIFQWVGEEGISSNEVIRRLNNLKILPKKQKRTTWTKGPIVRLLRNSTYFGDHFYYKSEAMVSKSHNSGYRRVKKTGRRIRPKEEWIKVQVPAIISKSLFEKTQKQLVLNSQLCRRNNHRNEYLLRSFVYCTCGKRRAGETTREGHSYYRCTDRLHKFPLPRTCFEYSVNSKVLDKLVWDKLTKMLLNPKMIAHQADRWLKMRRQEKTITSFQDIEKEKTALEKEEKRYIKAYGEDVMAFETYKNLINDIKLKRNLIQDKENNLIQTRNKIQYSSDWLVEKALESIRKYNFNDKRALICKLIDKIAANSKEAEIHGFLPVNVGSDVVLSSNYGERG